MPPLKILGNSDFESCTPICYVTALCKSAQHLCLQNHTKPSSSKTPKSAPVVTVVRAVLRYGDGLDLCLHLTQLRFVVDEV